MIVGTLIKEANNPDEEPIQPGTECHPLDQLFFENESGRAALKLSEEDGVHRYCTGVVVGVQGAVNNLGTFIVDGALIMPALPPLSMVPSGSLIPSSTTNSAPHLLIVSSLLCEDPNVPSLPPKMLVSYLQGQFTKSKAVSSHNGSDLWP
jgi:hypothetical protein